MKKTVVLFIVMGLICIFGLDARAYGDEETEKIAQSTGADKLNNEYLTDEEMSGDKTINIYQKVIDIISDAISDNKKGLIKSFGGVLAVIILCALMSAMKFGSDALDTSVSYISVLALSGVVYSTLYNLFIVVIASMETLTVSMSSMLPIMAGLYVSGGSVAVASASNAGFIMFLTALSMICTKIVLPLIQIAFALSICSAIPSGVNLSGVTNFIKNTATILLSFIFTLFSFLLFFQTAIASASDNLVTRSVKFASGAFVPVIGGMLGEATRTLIASVSVIKGTVGAMGTVIILSITIPPLIAVIVNKLMLLGCAIIAKTLGCEKESALLYDLGGILNILIALVSGACVVCIIGFSIFIKTGVTA